MQHGLYRGPVTPDDLFRVVGYGYNEGNAFGFRIVTFELPATTLVLGLEFGLAHLDLGDDNFIQVSGMSYTYDPSRPNGARLVAVSVGGVPIEPTQVFTTTANEFVLGYLNYLNLPVRNVRYVGDTTEYHLLARYVAAFDTIRPVVEGRIVATRTTGVGGYFATGSGDHLGAAIHTGAVDGTDCVSFRVNEDCEVVIEVYNLRGERVSALFAGRMSAGDRSVHLDRATLPAGFYLCRIAIGATDTVVPLRITR